MHLTFNVCHIKLASNHIVQVVLDQYVNTYNQILQSPVHLLLIVAVARLPTVAGLGHALWPSAILHPMCLLRRFRRSVNTDKAKHALFCAGPCTPVGPYSLRAKLG